MDSWFEVGYKPFEFEIFRLKIEALKTYQSAVIPQIKKEMNKLEKRWETEKEGLDEESLVHYEDFLSDEYHQLKDMEIDFYLLSTVAINSEIEALLKRLVGRTRKIRGGKEREWNTGQLVVFFETIGVPITEKREINILRRICNMYKHNEGLCDSMLAKNGFGKKGDKIEITSKHLTQFYKTALEFADDIIKKTPFWESKEKEPFFDEETPSKKDSKKAKRKAIK